MARKILLADDSVTAQNMGRKILADAGYEVITVNNGSAALKKIAEQKPDLIVLDVYMPGYSGLEVCQRLKEAGDTARTPILLTVGKLEPFKPEEARRVRADGFIVKPFEASELLSALSKLEDKIVPRPEPSKPGRFARATAAIEESRYDKSMAVDEDSGWKSRIVFPKKKEKEKEKVSEDIDDSAIYNPVNKDLRTVIGHEADGHVSAAQAHADPAEQERVNLGALAPEGLPKDVTPEEIAALAAAAAQVKNTLEQNKVGEEKATMPNSEMPATAAVEVPLATTETKKEKEEPSVAEPVPAATEATAAPEPAVTLAEPPKSEKPKIEAEPEIAATPSEVMAAIIGLEHSSDTKPGNGSWSSNNQNQTDEPVTMAVAASAAAGSTSSRWTAVAAALAPEETALSLEQEMQKAYAVFAAAETSRTESGPADAPQRVYEPVATLIAETAPEPAAPTEASTGAPDETRAAVSTPAEPAPEASSPFAEVASAAKEAVSAAISELKSIASSFGSQEPAPVVEQAPVPAAETAAPQISESSSAEPAKSEEPLAAEPPKAESPVEIKPAQPETEFENAAQTETKLVEIEARSAETEAKPAEPVPAVEEPPVVSGEESREEKPAVPAPAFSIDEKNEISKAVAEVASPAPQGDDVSEHGAIPKETVAEVVATDSGSPTAVTPLTGGIDEMAKKESENTAAAAWASWRKIRETGNSKPDQSAEAMKEAEESPVAQDSAAMAVAVGAESSPEEVKTSLDSDPEIASIVDSVLADMRPKIVEEIARKLGKKK